MRISDYRGFCIEITRVDKYQTYAKVTENSTGRVVDEFSNTGMETAHELKQMMKNRINVRLDRDLITQ